MTTIFRRRLRLACVLPIILLLGACATNRSYISLAVPGNDVEAASGDKVAVIGTIDDRRDFQEDPDDPSTPSLKKGDKYALDAEGRKSAVGRKRNGYGMAIGDIQLQPPQTVVSITRQLVATGLQQRGYRVVESADAPANALRVDVDIKAFWAWLTPGFWAIDMEGKLSTLLKVSGPQPREIKVDAYGRKTAPTGREDNWKQAYDRAFTDYLTKQQTALQDAGL